MRIVLQVCKVTGVIALALPILQSCGPANGVKEVVPRPTDEPTKTQLGECVSFRLANDSLLILATLEDRGIRVSVMGSNGREVVKREIPGHLVNVCRIRPNLQEELLILSTVGGSSQQYRLTVLMFDDSARTLLSANARPDHFTYLPRVGERDGGTTITYIDAASSKAVTMQWSAEKGELFPIQHKGRELSKHSRPLDQKP